MAFLQHHRSFGSEYLFEIILINIKHEGSVLFFVNRRENVEGSQVNAYIYVNFFMYKTHLTLYRVVRFFHVVCILGFPTKTNRISKKKCLWYLGIVLVIFFFLNKRYWVMCLFGKYLNFFRFLQGVPT